MIPPNTNQRQFSLPLLTSGTFLFVHAQVSVLQRRNSRSAPGSLCSRSGDGAAGGAGLGPAGLTAVRVAFSNGVGSGQVGCLRPRGALCSATAGAPAPLAAASCAGATETPEHRRVRVRGLKVPPKPGLWILKTKQGSCCLCILESPSLFLKCSSWIGSLHIPVKCCQGDSVQLCNTQTRTHTHTQTHARTYHHHHQMEKKTICFRQLSFPPDRSEFDQRSKRLQFRIFDLTHLYTERSPGSDDVLSGSRSLHLRLSAAELVVAQAQVPRSTSVCPVLVHKGAHGGRGALTFHLKRCFQQLKRIKRSESKGICATFKFVFS